MTETNFRPPLFPQGPPDWPPQDEAVKEAMLAAYADGSWGRYHGPHGEALKDKLAGLTRQKHAQLCASGTLAVELALRGLRIGPDDEVALAAYDFPGNFRAVESVGAKPVLVDLAPNRWTMDVSQLEAACGRVKAVIISHLHASLAPMREICEIASRHDVHVVEDACQAPGAVIDGAPAGSFGDVSVLSFGGSKLLTAGRGGAVLTSRPDVAQRVKIYCERGNDAYALSELQAAVLLPQLTSLHRRNEHRQQSVDILQRRCANLAGLVWPDDDDHFCSPSYYKVSWFFDPGAFGDVSRSDFLAAAQAQGLALYDGFRGFLRRSSARCVKLTDLPQAHRAVENTMLLHHPVLLSPPETIDRVAAALGNVASRFGIK